MHPAKTLYWLYAITNRLFGARVRIARDPLHRRYTVNKYGIGLNPREGLSTSQIHTGITNTLLSVGYDFKEGFYEKVWGKSRTIIHVYDTGTVVTIVLFSYST